MAICHNVSRACFMQYELTNGRMMLMFMKCKCKCGSQTPGVLHICARFQASPRKSHLKATKRILRYLKHTQNVGLWYPKGARFELIGYLDSDYAGCKVERESTSGICQLLGRSLVSWSSKKQNSVALSTAEA